MCVLKLQKSNVNGVILISCRHKQAVSDEAQGTNKDHVNENFTFTAIINSSSLSDWVTAGLQSF